MSFDLSASLATFHQALLDAFEPLLERLDAVPALQFLLPYRDSLPYVAIGLGLIVLLLFLSALRRGKSRTHRKGKGSQAKAKTSPASAPPAWERIQSRPLDDMSFFDASASFSTSLSRSSEAASEPVPPRAAAPKRDTPPNDNTDAPLKTARAGGAAPASEKAGPTLSPLSVPKPAPGSTLRPLSAPEPAPAPTFAPLATPDAGVSRPTPPRTEPASHSASSSNLDFQTLYIAMYIDLQLATNFSDLRGNVNQRLSGGASTEPLLPEGSASANEEIFACIALAALDGLHAPKARLDSGELAPHGQELNKIYRYALDRLKGNGRFSEERAEKLLQDTLDRVRAEPPR